MKILLTCYANSEGFDGCEHAIIELDDAAKKEILAWRELFQMVKSKADSVWSMSFWGIPGAFYDHDNWCPMDQLTDEQAALLESQQYIILPDDFEVPDDASRTECDRTVVTGDGVYWKCIAKHTDVYVETRQLPYEVLL